MNEVQRVYHEAVCAALRGGFNQKQAVECAVAHLTWVYDKGKALTDRVLRNTYRGLVEED